jgi:multicomponent Na+:H+ antiporter subunit D
MADVSPGLILIVGAVLVPLLRGRLRAIWLLALPVLALAHLLMLPHGDAGHVTALGFDLVTLRVDALSFPFALAFLVAAFLALGYSLYEDDPLQQVAALVYAGSAVGAVLAGDLVTLLVFWEGTALASVFLIWARRSERAYRAGMRYLLMQVASGLLLLAGIVITARQTGSVDFTAMPLGSLASWLILIAFGIKCAFPLVHSWLADAYPEATPGGTVVLSIFTTKLAVYALARAFPGAEPLILVGALMALFPVIFAVIENDLRRVLAWSLNSQLGFMVAGIGIGTPLALNGAVAHALASIVYQALLFMAAGAVLLRTGTARATDLGGLVRSMPWTAGFAVVGAAAISAVPLLSGFVSKAMILSAALEEGHPWLWLALVAGGAGAFLTAGLKVPYCAFFGADRGKRPAEAPAPMLAAMALAALLCLLPGLAPQLLYALLPYPVDYHPYTLEHVVTQLQLIAFAALGVALLLRFGLFPAELRAITLDVDWLWRRLGLRAALAVGRAADAFWRGFIGASLRAATVLAGVIRSHSGPGGALARTWATSAMAFWTTLVLALYLILSYI